MAWFRRGKDTEDSMDPQVLLAKANAADAAIAAGDLAPAPAPLSGSFRMSVEDVFTIRGRGTVVTGKVDAGTIHKNAKVRLTRVDGSARDVDVSGIEMFRKVVDTASAGDNVGLLLRGLERADVAAGDVLTA